MPDFAGNICGKGGVRMPVTIAAPSREWEPAVTVFYHERKTRIVFQEKNSYNESGSMNWAALIVSLETVDEDGGARRKCQKENGFMGNYLNIGNAGFESVKKGVYVDKTGLILLNKGGKKYG